MSRVITVDACSTEYGSGKVRCPYCILTQGYYQIHRCEHPSFGAWHRTFVKDPHLTRDGGPPPLNTFAEFCPLKEAT